MNKIISTGLVAVAALSLAGCGGGPSVSKKVTKVIMDDPIVGLGYRCSSSDEMKKTDGEGKFTCNEGDTVSFFIGKYEISTGVDVASGTADTMRITDLGIAEDAVTDIRQVLQTIDQDDNGLIEIPEDFDALDDIDTAPGNGNFDEKVGNKLEEETGNELVSGETADRHANERYLKYLLSGKTFYFVSHKYTSPAVIEVRFNSSLTNISFFKDSEAKGVSTLDLNDSKITMHDGGEDTTFTVEVKSKCIVVHAERNRHQFDAKMYTDLSDAQKQYDEETAGDTKFKALFAGKTFYAVEVGDDHVDVVTFNADLTTATVKEGEEEASDITLEVQGDKIYLGAVTDKAYATVEEETDEYILVKFFENDKLDDKKRFYFDRAKAEAYVEENAKVDNSLEKLLAGKTYYFVDTEGITKAVFSTDFTQAIVSDYAPDGTQVGDTDTETIELDGEKLIVDDNGECIAYISDHGDYLLFGIYNGNGVSEGELRAYGDKAKAEAYLATLGGGGSGDITKAQLTKALVGRTIYQTTKHCNGEIETVIVQLQANGKLKESEEGGSEYRYAPYTISGDKLTITKGGEQKKIKAVEITAAYVKFERTKNGKTDTDKWYYSKADAKAHPETYECHGGGGSGSECHVDGKKLVVDEGKTCSLDGHAAICEGGKIKVDNTFTSDNVVNINGYQFSCSK